jgi:hypothetical protein
VPAKGLRDTPIRAGFRSRFPAQTAVSLWRHEGSSAAMERPDQHRRDDDRRDDDRR